MRAALADRAAGLRKVSVFVLLALLMLFPGAPTAQDAQPATQDGQPRDVGLREEVDVDLVLVDFLVLDRQGRNVPGLGVDDFALKVGGRKTPIASVDVDCRTVDARDTAQRVDSEDPQAPAAQPRRIILVFDYFHMTNAAETIDRAQQMLDRWTTGDEIHTVISLARSVRVEAPPTKDVGDVRWALQRMRSDPDLYAETQASLTQYKFFDRMKALFDLVDQAPGRKSIVLFSGPFQPDAFLHDPEYSELSGLSANTRTSIYPVDAGGLRTPFDTGARPLGGPAELRRLANVTGGRVTADTNDIGLAYARAHADLGCTYTLGFYNTQPRLDRRRRLTIKVKRPNTRVVYPEFYLQRSPEEQHKSVFATATLAPHMFESDQVSTDLFVLGPASAEKWRTLMAIDVSLAPPQPGRDGGDSDRVEADGPVELRGFVRKPNGTIISSFKEKITRPADESETIRISRQFSVGPGQYVVSAVVSDPADPTPRAATRPVQLVRVPAGSPFLIGPILGHKLGEARASRKGDDADLDFEPLLSTTADHSQPLQSLTRVCVSGAAAPIDITDVARSVIAADGSPIEDFQTATVQLPGRGQTHCHSFVDAVGTRGLSPGMYEVSAKALANQRPIEGASAEFTIESSEQADR